MYLFRLLTLIAMSLIAAFAKADTMSNYMSIANQLPKMQMKADPQSQAWARSAHTVLLLTNESIAEALMQANAIALTQGKPFFCLPEKITLTAETMGELISETYRTISSQQSDKDKMTVSQIAWLGVAKKYPCQQEAPTYPNFKVGPQTIQHVEASR